MKILSLGKFIKQVRIAKKLSQGEVARRAGLARSYISRLEEGEYSRPSAITLNRLAKGLNVSNERIFAITGVSVRRGKFPAFDVYCRTKFGLSEEDIVKMQDYLELLKLKYANNNRQQNVTKPRG